MSSADANNGSPSGGGKMAAEEDASPDHTPNNGEEEELVDITDVFQQCASSLSVSEPVLSEGAAFSLQDAMAATQLSDPKMDGCEIPIDQIAPWRHQRTEYIGIDVRDIPATIMEQYQLYDLVHNGIVYARVDRGIPGVPQAGRLAKDRLKNSAEADSMKDDNNIPPVTMFPRPAPESLEDPFHSLPWQELTLENAAFLALEMLVRQVALLRGASVGESTLTCLYAHASVMVDMKERLYLTGPSETEPAPTETSASPPTLAQRIVYTTTMALVETTHVVRSVIINADIYEEEDFVAQTHGAVLFSELEPIEQEHNEAIDALTLLATAMKLLGELPDQEAREKQILLLVLGIQLGLLSCCQRLAKLSSSELPETVKGMQGICQRAIGKLEYLQEIVPDEYSDEVQSLLQRTFDSFVNRPMVGNAPVRKVLFLSPKESMSALTQILTDLDTSLCALLLQGSSLSRIRRLLDHVANSDVNILVRSLIVLNLYFDNRLLGQHSLIELLAQDMRQSCHIPGPLLESEPALGFLNRLAKPIYDTLKLQTLNRQRQRAYLEAVLLEEWGTQLQHEAQGCDLHLRQQESPSMTTAMPPPYFSHYVLKVLLQLMDRFVALSLDLGLCHGDDDICSAVWYRDFLLSGILNTTLQNRLESQQQDASTSTASSPAAKTTGKKGKGKKNRRSSADRKNGKNRSSKRSSAFDDKQEELEEAVLTLKRNLCRGVVRFIAALRQAEILLPHAFEFTSFECIFHKRFEVFDLIQQPQSLRYDDYVQGSGYANVSPDDLFKSTLDLFSSCKAIAEKLEKDVILLLQHKDYSIHDAPMRPDEIRSLIKVCVGNSVYLLKFRQLLADRSNDKPIQVEFDWTAHPQFCTIKLS